MPPLYRNKYFYFKKNIFNMEKFVAVMSKMKDGSCYRFKTILDEIDIEICIRKMDPESEDCDSLKYFLWGESPYIYTRCGNGKTLYGSYLRSEEELFKKVEELKMMKWNRVERCFKKEDTFKDEAEFLNMIGDHFEIPKCSVCLEACNEGLTCGHLLCMKCRNQMIKKRCSKCPICRKKNLKDAIDSDEESEDE